MRTAVTVMAVAAALGAPVAAQGATVTLTQQPGQDAPKGMSTSPTASVTVSAAPGEANHLTFTTSGASLVVRDPSAPLTPGGEGCAATAPGEVTCTATIAPEISVVTVDAGDGDDIVDATGADAHLVADGGPGDDTLRGGPQNDVLRPGTGDDRLDGGAGGDTVLYDERTAAVTIALDGAQPSGEASEHDTITGVEHATGGQGDDTLIGTPTADSLEGGPGNDTLNGAGGGDDLHGGSGADRLDGGAGDDLLTGDAGADTLRGGAGDDTIGGGAGADAFDGGPGDDRLDLYGDARPSAGEHADCGPGRDRAEDPDGREAIATDCERVPIGVRDVDLDPVSVALPVRRTRRGVLLRLIADPIDAGDAVRPRLVVRVPDGPIGRATTSLVPGQVKSVLVRMTGVRAAATVRITVGGSQSEDGERVPLAGGFTTTAR